MKLQFLGTSAGEGYPGLWCDCENCRYAREHGGRNIRENSCAILDDDVLIDLNMTAFTQARRFGRDLRGAKVLLVTHAHEDHFVTQHVLWRRATPGAVEADAVTRMSMVSPRFTALGQLHILGSRYVMDALTGGAHGGVMEGQEKKAETTWSDATAAVDFSLVRPMETVTFPDVPGLKVTAVPSHHGPAADYTYNYIIERGGKTLFYALDTGGYDDQVVEFLKKFRYNAVVMEGTFGDSPSETESHMNRAKNLRWFAFFKENGLFKNEPVMVLTHICPHWAPPHDMYAPEMEKEGITVAYDGMTLEI